MTNIQDEKYNIQIEEEVKKMVTEEKELIFKKIKNIEENMSEIELERALNQVITMEDLYDDVNSYLHKVNRALKKPYVSVSPIPQHLLIISNCLETMQTILIGMRSDSDYIALKDILKKRGGK